MLKNIIVQLALFLVILGIPSLGSAITMDTSTDGDQVTVTLKAVCAAVTCAGKFSVNFGDGSSVVYSSAMSFSSGTSKSWTTTHTYKQGNDYSVRGKWILTSGPVVAPVVVTKSVSVMTVSPSELEDAAVATEYDVRFTLKNGTPPLSFKKISGNLPPGLTLHSSGSLKGTPNRLGRYRFTIQFGDSKGKKLTRQYCLKVETGDVSIRTVPASYGVSRQGRVTKSITYEYKGTAVQDTLRSTRGEFLIGSSVVGYFNKGLILNVKNGKARSIESVTVPLTVIRKAEQMRVNKISYTRTFTSRSIVGKATSTLILSSGGGDFKVTKMRIYFDNNRPRKVIARSSKDTKASVQINYSGTGLLKGYWEVDGRILQRVQKNVRFGKSLILKTPSVPPLPTYAEGTHRLRFVISVPDQLIKFPTAYYDVVEKEKSSRTSIVLLTPRAEKHIQLNGTIFSWQPSKGVANYLISFFDQESHEEKPVFTAYTKELEYQLPSQAAQKFFRTGVTYTWLTLGLDKDGNIISESQSKEFSPLPQE